MDWEETKRGNCSQDVIKTCCIINFSHYCDKISDKTVEEGSTYLDHSLRIFSCPSMRTRKTLAGPEPRGCNWMYICCLIVINLITSIYSGLHFDCFISLTFLSWPYFCLSVACTLTRCQCSLLFLPIWVGQSQPSLRLFL